MAKHLFDDAGRYLAKATAALLPHVSNELLIENEIAKSSNNFGLKLISLTQAMAFGAVYLAADAINFKLPRDYSHNYDVFQHFTPNIAPAKANGAHTNGNGTTAKSALNGDRSLNGSIQRKATTNGKTNGTQTKKGLESNSKYSAILVQE